MKSTGIIRKVDELGRIVLPIELRRMMDISERDHIEIYTEGQTIVLKKYQPTCLFCNSEGELLRFNGRNVCPNCLKTMTELLPKE